MRNQVSRMLAVAGQQPLAILCVCLLLTACQKHFIPPPITAPPSIAPQAGQYHSTIAAQVSGRTHVSGTVGLGGGTYNNSNASPAANEGSTVSGGATGNEDSQSCGGPEYHRNSISAGSAHVTPILNSDLRTYGFTLQDDVSATGGFWKHHVGPDIAGICGSSDNTTASAHSDSTGDINLTFSGTAGVTDRLIVYVSGTSAAAAGIRVTDISGNPLPLSALSQGHGAIVDLPVQGPYDVTATLNNDISQAGSTAPANAHSDADVRIQSMRDALALGYGNTVTTAFRIPLPVYVSIDDLNKALIQQLFTFPNARYYPCRVPPGCQYTGLFLENPRLQVIGAWLVLTVHLGGDVSLFIPVNADLVLKGIPTVENNVLSGAGLNLQVESKEWIVDIASTLFADQIQQALQQKMQYNLQSALDKEVEKLKPSFPVPWGSVCLLFEANNPTLADVFTEKNGVTARFEVGLKEEDDPSQCPKNGTH